MNIFGGGIHANLDKVPSLAIEGDAGGAKAPAVANEDEAPPIDDVEQEAQKQSSTPPPRQAHAPQPCGRASALQGSMRQRRAPSRASTRSSSPGSHDRRVGRVARGCIRLLQRRGREVPPSEWVRRSRRSAAATFERRLWRGDETLSTEQVGSSTFLYYCTCFCLCCMIELYEAT